MSWNLDAKGANKREVLAAFNAAVDDSKYCEPNRVIKDVARVLTEHMKDDFVRRIRSFGHTNDNGENCTCAVLVNC